MPNSKQHTIAGLEACGWTLDANARTSKYLVYSRTGDVVKLLVGKSGALRLLQQYKPISDSQSITGGRRHLALQAVGRMAKQLTTTAQAQAEYESNL